MPGADEILVVENHHERGLLALYRRGERLVGTLTVDRPTQIVKYRRLITQRATRDEALAYAEASSR
ncbi:oxidoreductase C-terminal domain-containing protein [Geodermatophilus sp. URMC 62]|uniref:oxidoreductase C-terminal domain-containing protein n=1 Tax=Geodermatophilus sp. URMC 62 TaxID=3423414 RepID=UPI00406C1471